MSDLAVIETPSTEVVVEMTASEARRKVEQVRKNVVRANELLLELHDRRGWKAMGFDSWREFCEQEFRMSRSSAYNAINVAKVRAALEAGGVEGVEPTVRQANVVAREAGAVAKEVAEAVERGEEPKAAWEAAVDRAESGPEAYVEPEPEAPEEAPSLSPEEQYRHDAKAALDPIRVLLRVKHDDLLAVLTEDDYRRAMGQVRRWAVRGEARLGEKATARATEEVEPNFKSGRK